MRGRCVVIHNKEGCHVEIRGTKSVLNECEGCTRFGHSGLCRLVQSGLGLRVCGAVEGDGLS